MANLSDLSRAIDDAFTHTWFEIRKEAVNNILDATPISAALRERGCYTPQVGGDRITRTILYGKKTATTAKKGDVLTHGEDDIETMAWWDWKYFFVHAQRSRLDDQKNNGPSKIKSLVQTKIKAAREALVQKIESLLTAIPTTAGSAAEDIELRLERDPNSLYNILPGDTNTGAAAQYYNHATEDTYKFGNIDTSATNTWWQGKYKTANSPAEQNLLDDMRNLYNTCSANSPDHPNLIITDQTTFETYEDFAQDQIQQVHNVGSRMAQLGYEVLKFKGADLIWTGSSTWIAGQMMFLCTKYIDLVYDPRLWFEMGRWKEIELQNERVAHIGCTMQVVCDHMRRQGLLGAYA